MTHGWPLLAALPVLYYRCKVSVATRVARASRAAHA